MIYKESGLGSNPKAIMEYLKGEKSEYSFERFQQQVEFLERARRLNNSQNHRLLEAHVERLIDEMNVKMRIDSKGKYQMTKEQESAVREVCLESGGLSIVSGRAGAGKSVATGLMVGKAYYQSGYVVRGMSTAQLAVNNISDALEDVPHEAMNISKFMVELDKKTKGKWNKEKKRRDDPEPNIRQRFERDRNYKEVWIIDEAAMVQGAGKNETDKANLDNLLKLAEEYPDQIKVELIGEHEQLPSIDNPFWFRMAQDDSQITHAAIQTIMRQADDENDQNKAWRREMVEKTAVGDSSFIQELDERGLVQFGKSDEDSIDLVVKEFTRKLDASIASGETKVPPVITQRWQDKIAIDEKIREVMRERGIIKGADHKFKVVASDKNFGETPEEMISFAEGDSVRLTSNDYKLVKGGVSNGTTGTIKSIKEIRDIEGVVYDHEITLFLDKKNAAGLEEITFKASKYQRTAYDEYGIKIDPNPYKGCLPMVSNLSGTIMSQQGQTHKLEEGGIFYAGNIRNLSRSNTYVALSRCVHNTTMIVPENQMAFELDMEYGNQYNRQQLVELAGEMLVKEDGYRTEYEAITEIFKKNHDKAQLPEERERWVPTLENVKRWIENEKAQSLAERDNVIFSQGISDTSNIDLMAQEMNFVNENRIAFDGNRKELKDPIWHFSINFAPEDGKLTSEQMAEVAKSAMERLARLEGVNPAHIQCLFVQHKDKEQGPNGYQHFHGVLNRALTNGETLNLHNSKRAGRAVMRSLEKEFHEKYGITMFQEENSIDPIKTKRVEEEHFKRLTAKLDKQGVDTSLMEVCPREYIGRAVLDAKYNATSIDEFVEMLKSRDIEVRLEPYIQNINKNGVTVDKEVRIGISFGITNPKRYPAEMQHAFSGFSISNGATTAAIYEEIRTNTIAQHLEINNEREFTEPATFDQQAKKAGLEKSDKWKWCESVINDFREYQTDRELLNGFESGAEQQPIDRQPEIRDPAIIEAIAKRAAEFSARINRDDQQRSDHAIESWTGSEYIDRRDNESCDR